MNGCSANNWYYQAEFRLIRRKKLAPAKSRQFTPYSQTKKTFGLTESPLWWSWWVLPPRPLVHLISRTTGLVRFTVLGNGYQNGQTVRHRNPKSLRSVGIFLTVHPDDMKCPSTIRRRIRHCYLMFRQRKRRLHDVRWARCWPYRRE